MCADQLNLARDIFELERAGVDYLHLDVMDGNYVPNVTLGIDTCNAIKQSTDLPVDIHLLILHPEQLVASFSFGEGDIVSAHLDCISDVRQLSAAVRDRGAQFGIVLNPADRIEDALAMLPYADVVSLMMIEPGFAGRQMLDGSLEKIARVRQWLDGHGHDAMLIEVDGNVSFDHAPAMRRNGGDLFVAGSSSVFRAGKGIADGVAGLRSALEGARQG